jgi:hypothetical protein
MTDNAQERCAEAIQLEETMAALYREYSLTYECDVEFWRTLQREEEDHASILSALSQSHLPFGSFPVELLAVDAASLRDTRCRARQALEALRQSAPPDHEAYRLAADLEESKAELLLQDAVSRDPTTPVMKLVQEVIGESKDHAARIRQLIARKDWGAAGRKPSGGAARTRERRDGSGRDSGGMGG